MVSYRVEDMTCGGCAAKISRALKQVDAGAEVDVSVDDRLVRVRAPHAGEAELAGAIRQAGYTPVQVEEGTAAAPRSGGCCCGGGGGGCRS